MSVAHPRTPLEKVIDALAARGKKPRGNDKGWTALCPAHNDNNPSLSIGTGNDGRVLVHCHTGCHTSDILGALDLGVTDLFDGPTTGTRRSVEDARYRYEDQNGHHLYDVIRYWPKDFRQQAANGAWTTRGITKVPYRLPRIVHATRQGATIYVVEGEKDVHAIERTGHVATTNPGGAGKWRTDYNQWFTGADVIVVADRDTQRLHALEVANHLEPVATTVQVMQPALGKDVSDHLAAGLGLDELHELGHQAPDTNTNTDTATDPIGGMFVNWAEFFTKDRGDTDDWTIDDVLASGRGHSIFAKGKTGKSELVLRLVVDHVTNPDNTDVAVVPRLRDGRRRPLPTARRRLRVRPTTDFAGSATPRPRHPTPRHPRRRGHPHTILEWVQHQHPDSHLIVIIDTIGRAVEGAENDNDTILRFYRHTGAMLRRREATWARLDHTGHENSEGPRGGSAKLDDIDIAWELKRTDDGTELVRRASRLSWVPERVAFVRRRTRRHLHTGHRIVARRHRRSRTRNSDELESGCHRRPRVAAAKHLRDTGWTGRNEIVAAARDT